MHVAKWGIRIIASTDVLLIFAGDGTVRKNPGIWRHWNQNGALALHPLQLSIALRGARVTRVGGYSEYNCFYLHNVSCLCCV